MCSKLRLMISAYRCGPEIVSSEGRFEKKNNILLVDCPEQ